MTRRSHRRHTFVVYRSGGSGVGGAGFVPTDISGLQLWLKADAITGLNDGDSVTTWSDSSGQGNDATQATAAQKPVYKTSIVNGKPVVRFDGTDDKLVTTNSINFQTIIAVVSQNVNQFGRIVGDISGGGQNGLTTTGSNFYGVRFNDTAFNIGAVTGSFRVITAIGDATDAVTAIDGTPTSRGPATFFNPRTLVVGNDGVAPQPFSGDIAEIIVYDTALSTANRQLNEARLNTKYAIY